MNDWVDFNSKGDYTYIDANSVSVLSEKVAPFVKALVWMIFWEATVSQFFYF